MVVTGAVAMGATAGGGIRTTRNFPVLGAVDNSALCLWTRPQCITMDIAQSQAKEQKGHQYWWSHYGGRGNRPRKCRYSDNE